MASKTNELSPLSEDILYLINSIKDAPELSQLCKDHSGPILLKDGQPVLDITQDELLSIFDLKSNHYFPGRTHMLRFGIYCDLGLPNIISLILKSDWEYFIYCVLRNSKGSRKNLDSILTNIDLIEKHIVEFSPSSNNITKLFASHKILFTEKFTKAEILHYIGDIFKNQTFIVKHQLIEDLYGGKEHTEELILQKMNNPQREEYMSLKQLWIYKSGELDEFLLLLEQKKKSNLETENNYLRTFGNLEIKKANWNYRVELYNNFLQIIDKHPELSCKEIYGLAVDISKEELRESVELKNNISRSFSIISNIIPIDAVSTVSPQFLDEYKKQCKKLLKKLYFMLHQDTSPFYEKLNPGEKTEINKLWMKLMKSTKNEMHSYTPSMLLYNLPDIDHLRAIYHRACEILGIEPDEEDSVNRLDIMIKHGASARELVAFLKSETSQIELHLAHLELVKNEYTNEDRTLYYNEALSNIIDHKENLKKEIEDLKTKVSELKETVKNSMREIA